MKAKLASIVIFLAIVGCRNKEPAVATSTSNDTIHGVVDSIFPVEEDIRRFKAARNGASATELSGGSPSRDALVNRFMKALEKRDTAEMRAMVMDASEFIDLYYPTSIYSHPPYKQSPEITWLLMTENGEKGIKRALERYGGVPPHFQNYSCKSQARAEGANHFWEECKVRWAPTPDAPSPIRIFGSIIERGGRFKFVSYANDL